MGMNEPRPAHKVSLTLSAWCRGDRLRIGGYNATAATAQAASENGTTNESATPQPKTHSAAPTDAAKDLSLSRHFSRASRRRPEARSDLPTCYLYVYEPRRAG